MQRPWMPLYVGDYLAKTGHLTTLQHGAYLLLIMHYWANGGLPTDEKELMAIARLPADQWASNCHAIARFFDSKWRHRRIDEELIKCKNVSEKRSLAGLKGAWAKHKSHNGHSLANANTLTLTYKKEGKGVDRGGEGGDVEASLERLRKLGGFNERGTKVPASR